MKKFSLMLTKAQKLTAFFITIVMLFQICFMGQTANALDIQLKLNGSDTKVSVTGFLGTTADGNYIVDKVIAYNLPDMKNKQFNKYAINYTASDIVKGTITYKTAAGHTLTEDFFLESGSKVDFTSLMDETATVDGKKIGNIIGIKPLQLTFEPIRENTKIVFKLYSFDTSMGHRPVNDTMYIENERFKVGVYMAWGGGVNYVEDKLDGDDTVGNMLNSYDAGRLVQQSYYGTTKAPYECATYVDTKWGYNPVQGGDQYNNKSKLIDFTVTEDTIYIKCRPLDWAKNGVYTFVYMENTYSVKEDYIEVDNRYIDFSNYDHGSGRHQELPAFYTISYLDTFTYYGGSKPWTDDTLTSENNLPFWGDSETQKQCYFDLEEKNTETWCAWNSSETGYGIGLYTPQVEKFLAGRCEYDGSKNPKAFPTNYVAPLITTSMKNFEPFSYSYIIATGDVDTIRSTFKEHKDEFNWKKEIDYIHLDFKTSDDLKALTRAKKCNLLWVNEGIMKVTTAGEGDVLAGEFLIDTSKNSKQILGTDYGYLTYTYMVPKSNSKDKYSSRIYICQGKIVTPVKEYSIPVELICDGEYHTEVINLNDYKDIWTSTGSVSKTKVNSIKLAYFEESAPNDVIYISNFGLATDEAAAVKYGEDAKKTDPATFDPDMMQYTAASDTDRVAQLEIKENNETETAPTATPAQSDENKSSFDWGTILIIIIVGAVVVVAIVVFIIVRSLKKIKKSEAESNGDEAK